MDESPVLPEGLPSANHRMNKGEVRQVALNNLRRGADFLKTQYAEESMFFQGRLVTLSDECLVALKRVAEERHVKVAMHHTENTGFKRGVQLKLAVKPGTKWQSRRDNTEAFSVLSVGTLTTVCPSRCDRLPTGQLLPPGGGETASPYVARGVNGQRSARAKRG